MDLEKRVEQFEDDFLEFEKVEPKLSQRADLHAFILLDRWFPGHSDIVCHAQHDEIFLNIDDEQLDTLSDTQLQELVRCGVRMGDGCAKMFV